MTSLVPTLSIAVSSNRQRREFDEAAMQELIASIEEKGLLHAPVVRVLYGGQLALVAGERRLRAVTELAEFGKGFRYDGVNVPAGSCPVTTLGELDDLAASEAELEENIRRVDLSWQERVAAEADLVRIREEQAKRKGVPADRDAVVKEIKGVATPAARTSVSEAITLAKNLHRPEVAKAKSQTDAIKALKREEERERNQALAAALGAECSVHRHKLVQGDCIEWMKAQEEGTFDVICSDPPYGMGADEFGDSGKQQMGEHFYKDSVENWLALMAAAIPEITRLAKPSAHMYLFCDFDRFHPLKRWVEDGEQWSVFRTPLIWFKPTAFRAPWPDRGPQRKYECILYAVRGELKCNHLAGDVITCQPDENLGHPAQKPVALIKDLLARSVRPGFQVLDPFCGSGPVFEAAHALQCFATGVEQDLAACGIAAGRLAKLGAK